MPYYIVSKKYECQNDNEHQQQNTDNNVSHNASHLSCPLPLGTPHCIGANSKNKPFSLDKMIADLAQFCLFYANFKIIFLDESPRKQGFTAKNGKIIGLSLGED
jgi:hypothetical protein